MTCEETEPQPTKMMMIASTTTSDDDNNTTSADHALQSSGTITIVCDNNNDHHSTSSPLVVLSTLDNSNTNGQNDNDDADDDDGTNDTEKNQVVVVADDESSSTATTMMTMIPEPPQNPYQLFEHVRSNDIERVKHFIRNTKGYQLFRQDDANSFTALHLAAHLGRTEICRLLIEEAHMDLTAYSERIRDGFMPVHLAADEGHMETMDYLLSVGIERNLYDVNVRMNNPFSSYACIHLAAFNGDLKLLRHLIEYHHADHELPLLGQPWTILMLAANAGHYEIVQYLVQEVKMNVNQVLRYDSDDTDEDGGDTVVIKEFTTIHLAMRQAHYRIIELLLDHGASFHRPLPNGDALIHVAAYQGLNLIIQQLINKGENVNRISNSEYAYTPLHWAAAYNKMDCVRYLLHYGADASIKCSSVGGSRTPAEVASVQGHEEIVKFIDWFVTGRENAQKERAQRALNCALRSQFTDCIISFSTEDEEDEEEAEAIVEEETNETIESKEVTSKSS